MNGKLKILHIPDLHCPFQHRDAFDFLDAVRKKQAPDVVVCAGDELDQHALSPNHDHDPDGMGPGDELTAGIKALRPLMQMFPQMKICTSNHTERIYRRAFKFGIPSAYLKTYREWMDAPKGWEWADEWMIDRVGYSHGEGVSGPEGALKLAIANACPWAIGHLHSDAGTRYYSTAAALIWGLNSGWLGDSRAYAMAYGKRLIKRGILACSIVNRGWPFILPMLLGRDGRWLGPKTL